MRNRLTIVLGLAFTLCPGMGAAAQPLPDEPPSSSDEDVSFADGKEPIIGGRAGNLRMLLQVRYRSTFADESRLSSSSVVAEQQKGMLKSNDGFDLQRAFLRYVVSPAKRINAKFLIDFAELDHGNPKRASKLAYVEARVAKRLQIDFGLLKRPYSLLELLPIAKHELADLGPTDDFIKKQGYGGRDIGTIIRLQPLPSRRMMTASVGAFRGDLDEGFDASPLKLLGARIATQPVKHLHLGVNAVWRPYDNVALQKSPDINGAATLPKSVTMRRGAATGTDVTLAYRHFEVRGEFLVGKRTDPVQPGNGSQGSFWAAWLVVAPRFSIGKWLLVPAAKVELLDTDALNPNGQRCGVTGVFGVVPTSGLRIIADVTRTWTDKGVTSLQTVPRTGGYVPEPSSTGATLQLQAIY